MPTNKQRWLELCEKAVKEPDSVRFRQLIGEINELLDDSDGSVEPQLQPVQLSESIKQQ